MQQQFIDALIKSKPPLDDFLEIMARNDIDVVPYNKALPPPLIGQGRIAIETDLTGRVVKGMLYTPPGRFDRRSA